VFSDPKRAPPTELPDTGVERKWEENLSSIFVWHEDENYGTRSQTVVVVDKHGMLTFAERSLRIPSLVEKETPSKQIDTLNGKWSEVCFCFKIENEM
jgi:uncharacterized protein with NRDE domain